MLSSHQHKEKPPRCHPRRRHWWRRRDSCSIPFGTGWTMPSSCKQDAGRVIGHIVRPILVPARRQMPVGESMSLYRAGLRLALFLPLGVTSCRHLRHVRLHRCEPRCHFTLASEGDLPDRTRVRKPYVPGPTCLAVLLILVVHYPSGREDDRPAQAHFNEPALSTLDTRACERVPRVWMHKHTPVEG
jgi:hypothetical protein